MTREAAELLRWWVQQNLMITLGDAGAQRVARRNTGKAKHPRLTVGDVHTGRRARRTPHRLAAVSIGSLADESHEWARVLETDTRSGL